MIFTLFVKFPFVEQMKKRILPPFGQHNDSNNNRILLMFTQANKRTSGNTPDVRLFSLCVNSILKSSIAA